MNGPLPRGFGLTLAILLVGCESGAGKASGEADAAAPGVLCERDFTRLADAERVSLHDDVMPIFGLRCTMSQCHSSDNPAAGLYLGVRCVFDEKAPHRCTFPDSPDPNAPFGAMPLTLEIVDRVYRSVRETSNTAPGVWRVAPGDPDGSFLVEKVGGTHNDRGYDCVALAPGGFGGPCGGAMPFGSNGLCDGEGYESAGPSDFNTIAAWVAQGARND